MRQILAATVLAVGLSAPVEARAQWMHQGNESAFGDSGLHIAVTASGRYGFGIRCRGDLIEMLYVTPDTSFDKSTYTMANLTKPKLRVRVDDSTIVDLEGELVDIDGTAALLAEIDLDLVYAVRDAKRRVAVVLQLIGENYHENSFGVRGSTAATNKMLVGCNLPR